MSTSKEKPKTRPRAQALFEKWEDDAPPVLTPSPKTRTKLKREVEIFLPKKASKRKYDKLWIEL